MKKLLVLMIAFFAVVGLSACEQKVSYELPEEITMANIDEDRKSVV